MNLLRYLANLGYGSRKQVQALLRAGAVCDHEGAVLYADDTVGAGGIEHAQIRIDGQPLDLAPGLLLMLHKPVGYTCSHRDQGRLIHELLPARFRLRKPQVSSVGRLDRDTSGLLLLTDDGALLHRIVSPKSKLPKHYRATLAQDLRGDETDIFASGTLLLDQETTPLLPAELHVIAAREARLTLHEGRYHQVRRMFAAVGNHVETLHRERIGGLELGDLPAGQWRVLGMHDLECLFR